MYSFPWVLCLCASGGWLCVGHSEVTFALLHVALRALRPPGACCAVYFPRLCDLGVPSGVCLPTYVLRWGLRTPTLLCIRLCILYTILYIL